jgi:hypothetical protein
MNSLILGYGRLGQKHAESLYNVGSEVFIYDPYCDTAHFNNSISNHYKWATNLSEISHLRFKIAVSASPAINRFESVQQILKYVNLERLILEKPIEQSASRVIEIERVLRKAGVPAYVNCPRLYYPIWKNVQFDSNGPINMTYKNANWGFLCNSIHLISLFLQLNNYSEVTKLQFDKVKIKPSKRSGFSEADGRVLLQLENGAALLLEDQVETDICFKITVKNEEYIVNKDETELRDMCGQIKFSGARPDQLHLTQLYTKQDIYLPKLHSLTGVTALFNKKLSQFISPKQDPFTNRVNYT